jgi:hypothetical protein
MLAIGTPAARAADQALLLLVPQAQRSVFVKALSLIAMPLTRQTTTKFS